MSTPKTTVLIQVMLLTLAFVLTGCEQVFEDRAGRAADRADKKFGEGDFQAAIGLYEQALDGSEKTAEIHYKMGMIYEDKLNSTTSAMHHFRRYLELAPKGAHAKDVQSILKQIEIKMVQNLSSAGTMTQTDAARLKNQNLELQKKNAELKEQIKEQVRFATQSPGQRQKEKMAEAQRKPIPPGAKTYVVAPGDTLASISRKFYKGPARWKDIQDANFNTLEGTAKLKPGMTLVIP